MATNGRGGFPIRSAWFFKRRTRRYDTAAITRPTFPSGAGTASRDVWVDWVFRQEAVVNDPATALDAKSYQSELGYESFFPIDDSFVPLPQPDPAIPPPEELSILTSGYYDVPEVVTPESDVYQIYEAAGVLNVEVIITLYDPELPDQVQVLESVHYLQIDQGPEEPAIIELHLDDPSWDIAPEDSVISIVLDEATLPPEEVTIIQAGYYDFRPEEVLESDTSLVIEDATPPVETDVPESYVSSIEEEIQILESILGLSYEDPQPEEQYFDIVSTDLYGQVLVDESYIPNDPIEDAPPELEVIYQITSDEFEISYYPDDSAVVYYTEDAPVIVSTMRVWIGRGSVVGSGTRVFIKG